MRVKFLAPALVTGVLLSATTPMRAAAQQAVPATDSSFIQTAASLGLLQAKLGKLAAEKASSPSVKEFGRRMVDDYAKVNEQLAEGAKQAAYPAPVLLREHKLTYDRVARSGRSSFDKNYMAEMVNQYNAAVQLFQQESERGKVASLKQLATTLLPTVQQHLSVATQTAGTVGADVTAAAEGERQGS